MITRFVTLDGIHCRIEGELTGENGLEEATLTFYAVQGDMRIAGFHVDFLGGDREKGLGRCAPTVTPDCDTALIQLISVGSITVAALAAAFSISDEELAGEINSYGDKVSA